MKRLVAGAVLALVMFGSVGTGVAFADHGNGAFAEVEGCGTPPECLAANGEDAPHWAPVGRNFFDPSFPGEFTGIDNGGGTLTDFDDDATSAVFGLSHNPNCPVHWLLVGP